MAELNSELPDHSVGGMILSPKLDCFRIADYTPGTQKLKRRNSATPRAGTGCLHTHTQRFKILGRLWLLIRRIISGSDQ